MLARLVIIAWLGSIGCATKYAYTFQLASPGARVAQRPGDYDVLEDGDLKAGIAIDTTADALLLDLTNKTDQVIQVDWAKIAITRPSGGVTLLRPDVDLGWLAPGAHVAARLFPVALPRSGSAAATDQGRQFQIDVPVIVRREPKQYHFALVAHVREL